MSEIANTLQRLFASSIAGYDSTVPLTDQIDSLALFELSSQIEKEFKIHLYSVELTRETMGSLINLEALIAAKQKQPV